MEFWGVEVKPGETLKVKPDSDSIIHLSQAALGETKKEKANENILLYAKVGDQKLVMGTLSSEKFPQLSFDVVFEKEFELSHTWKNGSIYLCGYQSPMPVDDENDLYESSDDDQTPMMNAENGKPEIKSAQLQADAKPKGKAAEAAKIKQDPKDSDDDEELDDEDGYDEGAEDMSEDGEDDEDDSEDEETPKKVDAGKKRANESGAKGPEGKKAKILTPQKTDGKKANAAHTATPHPAKKPAAAATKQTPKSGGQFSCKSCDRSFNSDNALQSHAKAKHK